MVETRISHYLSGFFFNVTAAVAAALKKPRKKSPKKKRWKSEEAAEISLVEAMKVAVTTKRVIKLLQITFSTRDIQQLSIAF